MARPSPPDVEILVHVAAPSRADDDAAYRALAQAYLDFAPASVTTLQDGHDTDAWRHDPILEAPVAASASQALEHVFGAQSQELSFRSALDNRASPRLLPSANPATPFCAMSESALSDSTSSFVPPASQISDSYPLPDVGIFDVTPTKVLQRYLSASCTFPPGTPTSYASSPRPRPEPATGAESDIVDVPSSLPVPGRDQEEPASSPQERHPRDDVIPVTPIFPPPQKRKHHLAPEDVEQSMLDITHVSSSFIGRPSTSTPSRAESEPPLPKRAKSAGAGRDARILERSASDAGALLLPPSSSSNPLGISDHVVDSLEIRPPSPPAGSAHVDPSSLVSDKLAKLARDLSSRYNPDARRALDPLERGYWLLDCSRWPPQTRRDTWVFLTNYLRSGLAGWGVWCRRGAAPGYAWIRLYGWACVAKHTYLLLYLASGREVRAGVARWYDAEGQVAVEVAASPRHGMTLRGGTPAVS
ncbi:hypothetical protein HIM_03961 [Hirsutella minnesotensis 3608]|uniref:Uncharacterized protein n=1 Tax=Hirsutella minnesotensis 3608 TaxID=1043627 RepID=A0A0F7ZQ48_9HYPO|nr:hypothetical protein HIM_03961 [Hirsutella minnesotensis 3608]